MGKLTNGTLLKSDFSTSYSIVGFIKQGGQGSVYRVSNNGKTYALKWYSKNNDSLVKHFRELIQHGVPKSIIDGKPDMRFVWPQDLIEVADEGFGYVMDLIDMKKYLTLHQLTYSLYIKNEDKITVKCLCDICINIAEAFASLHSDGYCYKDISSNNIIFNITSGDVLIFDVDNVVVSGTKGEIKGTPKFMAPEVILDKTHPDRESDRFSLAAYFFHLLVGHYPFEGKLRDDYVEANGSMDDNGFKTIYGSEAVFCFNTGDMRNNLNDPDYKKVVERWNNTIPLKLKEKFVKTFVKGLPFDMRSERTTDKDWVKLFNELKNKIAKCSCEKEHFPGALKCIKCGTSLTASPTKIRVQEKGVMPNKELELHGNSVIKGKKIANCLSNIPKLAEVVVSPKTGHIGLKNLSGLEWHYKDIGDPALQVVPNNKVVTLKRGRVIAFVRNEVQITIL